MTAKPTTPEQEAFARALFAVLEAHQPKLTAWEMLAITANFLGGLIAFQNSDEAPIQDTMDMVFRNMEIGNHTVLHQLRESIPSKDKLN